MFWPSLVEYSDAIQSPAVNLRDPELAEAEVATDPLGLPRVSSGSFATVFRLDRGDESWAVKCFFRNIPERHERYRKISEAVQHANVPYLIDCDYQEQGIYIGSDWYPILKMPWVEGVHLNQFVVEHLDHPGVLRNVAQVWLSMLRGLRGAGIAHGDLQHGNVLIVGDRLRLVDYDGMYVPTLEDAKSLEQGHPEYQHPRRGRAFGLHLDRFPGLVVYAALRAVTYEPRLWTPTDNGENLLFRQMDYGAPADSDLLATLQQCPQDEVRVLAEQVQKACEDEPDAVPDVLELADPDEVLVSGRSSSATLPVWLAPLYPEAALEPAPTLKPEAQTADTIEQADEGEPVAIEIAPEEPAAPSPWWRTHVPSATAAKRPAGSTPAPRKSRPKLFVAVAAVGALALVALIGVMVVKGRRKAEAAAQIYKDLRVGKELLTYGQIDRAAHIYGCALEKMAQFRRQYGRSGFDQMQDEVKRSLSLARARQKTSSDLAAADRLRTEREYAKAKAAYESVLKAAKAAQPKPADAKLQRVITRAQAALEADDIRLGSKGHVEYRGKWVTPEDKKLMEEGFQEYAGKLRSPEEIARLKKEEADRLRKKRERVEEREDTAAKASFEQAKLYLGSSRWAEAAKRLRAMRGYYGRTRFYRQQEREIEGLRHVATFLAGVMGDCAAGKHGKALQRIKDYPPQPGSASNKDVQAALQRAWEDVTRRRDEYLRANPKVIDLGRGVTLELVWIPPGEFLMGSPDGERGRDGDEGSQHRVRITKGFWMGKYEVTQKQWETVMGHNPSRFKGDGRRPVESVSWDDCQEFLKKLNSRASSPGFRLPTEAEWEYACRAGTTTRFYWGDHSDSAHAWYRDNSGRHPHPVGEKKPNAWGLYDMSGNVWEWCHDRYGNYSPKPVTDPRGPSSGSNRVLRGGSWTNYARYCRSSNRLRLTASNQYNIVGVRLCVRDF